MMNRNKKIAMAVVSTVMAGALVVPLAACNNNDRGPKVDLGEAWNVLDANGNIDYNVYNRETPVTLNIAIGHNNNITSTAFAPGSTYTLPDGKTYQGGAMKPAWEQMGKDLHITWNDVFAGKATNANLNDIVNGSGKVSYEQTDMFTTDLSIAVDRVSKGTDILNLADYLDYMPNFKAFLNENPIVYLSLLQDGMSTQGETAGQGQALYIAPYFDGNNDIERYCIIRQDWVSYILGNAEITGSEKFTEQCTEVAVQPYMTGMDNLPVDITLPTPDANGNYNQVGKVYKNYKNVKTQVTTDGSALNVAYKAASGGAAYGGTSGNIVELMNAAIGSNANVTGPQLVNLFRAYVDACYTTTADGTTSYYSNRADLFNGYDAAWDVDDLVAMLRCVMTNQNYLLSTDPNMPKRAENRKIYGIAPRSGQNDRTPDMVRLACQLYGARGGESRYEYTYIDKAGNLQDARNDKAFYQALENMSKLSAEGLVADYTGYSDFSNASGYIPETTKDNKTTPGSETFMMYDYCQSQTSAGFYAEGVTGKDMPRGYNFAPILTPVSKWDVNGDGNIGSDEHFRFTESWRSVKTSGLALNGELAYNKDKLIAALQFVDYLYSADGQIVSTYGPMATYNETTQDYEGGFWQGKVATDEDITANKYFTYKGVKYAGTNYKGTTTPKITEEFYDSFRGLSDNANPTGDLKGAITNFTNYARYLIGSTLPIGVKDQSFENQLTSEMGQVGAAKVGAALSNKVTGTNYTVVRGMSLDINENDWWYTCVPTGLPVPVSYVSTLTDATMNQLRYMSGDAKTSGDKNFLSLFNIVILQGITGTFDEQEQTYTFTTLDALVTYMSSTRRAQDREDILARGWNNAKTYWDYLKPVED